MTNPGLFVALALAAGAAIAVQQGVNATLGRTTGLSVWAALASFTVGTAALAVAALAFRQTWPAAEAIARVPWWGWVGGLLGAFYVLSAIVAAPRLGAGLLVGLVVAGQVLAALAIDHLGLVGYAERAITPLRVVGAALLVAGVAMIRAF